MAVQVTDDTFDSVVLKSSIPVLVDFWAPWCGPCRAVAPVVEELAGEFEGKAVVAKMDVDENPATPGKYGIRSIPSFLLFKNGSLVDQTTGAGNKASLKELIERHL